MNITKDFLYKIRWHWRERKRKGDLAIETKRIKKLINKCSVCSTKIPQDHCLCNRCAGEIRWQGTINSLIKQGYEVYPITPIHIKSLKNGEGIAFKGEHK